MSRIQPIEDHEQTDETRNLIAYAQRNGAPDPRIVAIYTRSEAGRAFFEFWNKLMASKALPLRLKELVRLRASVSHECGYCTTVRSAAARDEGVTEDLIAEMFDYEYSDRFTHQERAAMQFIDSYKKDLNFIDDDAVWTELRRHFTDPQIIELNILAQLLSSGSGFVKALQLVSWDEACSLTPEIQAVIRRRKQRETVRQTAAE